MEDSILAEPYLPEGQELAPPEGIGLGVEVDSDKLVFYHQQQSQR